MAAAKTYFWFSKLGLLLRPAKNIYFQTRTISKAGSARLCPRTLLIRNACRFSVVCEENNEHSAWSSKTRADFKTKCYHIRKLCEGRKLHEASKMLDKLLESFSDTNASFTNVFNCAIHHAVKSNEDVLVDRFLSNMKEHGVKRDSATYYILTLHCSQRGLLDEGIDTIRQMQVERIRGTPRNYIPLILLAARLGKLETMFSLYEEMKSKHTGCHQVDSAVIRGVLDSNETEHWNSKVFEILHSMKEDRVKLSRETASAVAKWFSCQGSNGWQVNWSTVNSR